MKNKYLKLQDKVVYTRVRQRIVVANLLIALLLIVSVPVVTYAVSNIASEKLRNWGIILKEFSEKESSNNDKELYSIVSTNKNKLTANQKVSKKDIYMVGKDSLITNSELELSTKFYLLSTNDEDEAKIEAKKFVKEHTALYAKAITEGYTVTDQEVYDYLETLKVTLSDAENREDIEQLIQAYGSEDEYWEYMFQVYQKDLPIQKYVADLEQKYAKKMNLDRESTEFNEFWDTEFETIKSDLVKVENYQELKENQEVPNQFRVD